MRTVLYNCGPMIHFDSETPLVGKQLINDNWIYSAGKAIIIDGSQIVEILDSGDAVNDFESHMGKNDSTKLYDVKNKAVIPGIIDSHSHLVWGGDRSREVRLRQQGKTYAEIANMGGGINSTVLSTRALSENALFEISKRRAMIALSNGTTHLETKSGYGLSVESEIKLLKVAKRLQLDAHTPSIDSTWLGAHAVPKNHTQESYVEELISNQLPAIAETGLARSADVFCEPGWFTLDESEYILNEAKSHGLALRMHIDEFCDGGGGELAAKLKVDTADHAHHTSETGRQALKNANVNTGFLPGTPYSMGTEWPDFNSMINTNAPWTIASDFNPNNQVLSIPFIASCLVQRCKVDPLATLAACTINPSFTTPHNSGLSHGKIAVGAIANINILQSQQWESWCLTPGHSPVDATFMAGEKVNEY